MSFWQALVLSTVQGLTEFLPISSSGHLALGAKLLGLPSPGLGFSIWVHLGTALATIVMLRGDIVWLIKGIFSPKTKQDRQRSVTIAGYIILASIPAAIVGLLFEEKIESMFSSTKAVSIGLIVTGFVLLLSKRPVRNRPVNGGQHRFLGSVTLPKALTSGIFQAIAIVPGISRSGMTITSGLVSGMSREDAARFSFLLSLPATIGAGLLDAKAAISAQTTPIPAFGFLGAAVSFVTGLFALAFLLKIVRKGELSKFSYYCWIVGVVSLIVSFI